MADRLKHVLPTHPGIRVPPRRVVISTLSLIFKNNVGNLETRFEQQWVLQRLSFETAWAALMICGTLAELFARSVLRQQARCLNNLPATVTRCAGPFETAPPPAPPAGSANCPRLHRMAPHPPASHGHTALDPAHFRARHQHGLVPGAHAIRRNWLVPHGQALLPGPCPCPPVHPYH